MFPGLMSLRKWTISFVSISFLVANFGLETIIAFSVPVLMFLYPITIGLVLLWWINALVSLDEKAFKFTIWVASIPAFFDLIKSAPPIIKNTGICRRLLVIGEAYIPLFKQGIGWLIPVVICLIISLIFFRAQRRDSL